MSHLTYAKIQNLAGRDDDVEIKFDRHQNIIFGVNGVGKTTLLKILHSAFYGDESILHGLPFKSAEVGMYSVAQDREIIRFIENESEDNAPSNDEEYLTEYSDFINKDGRVIRQTRVTRKGISWVDVNPRKGDRVYKLRHEYLPTTRLISAAGLMSASRGGELINESGLDQMMAAKLQEQWLGFYSPLQKKLQDAQQKGIAQILSTVLSPDNASPKESDLSPDLAYKLARNFLLSNASLRIPSSKASFINRYKSENSLAAVVNQIASIENEIELLKRPRDQLQELLNKLFFNKSVDLSGGEIKISFGDFDEQKKSNVQSKRSRDAKKALSLFQLSSGEKQALYILIHALRAEMNSLLIDEPELSMHIDWQRELIQSMLSLNPDLQLVAATHSPEVMAFVPDNCIFEI